MKQIRQNLFAPALGGLPLVVVSVMAFSVWADESRDARLSAKRQQRELARFLKDYRGVKTLALRRGFVDDAIKRGAPFSEGLRRQLELEVQRDLEAYRKLFLGAIEGAPRITPKSIVASNDKLKKQREYLLLMGDWMERLQLGIVGPANLENSRGETKSSRIIEQREQQFIDQWLSAKGVGRISNVEASLIRQVNHYRAEEGLPPLKLDYRLCAAARDHSRDMTKELFFSHKSEFAHKLTYAHRAVRFGTTARGRTSPIVRPRTWWFPCGRPAPDTAARCWIAMPPELASVMSAASTR